MFYLHTDELKKTCQLPHSLRQFQGHQRTDGRRISAMISNLFPAFSVLLFYGKAYLQLVQIFVMKKVQFASAKNVPSC